MTTLITHIFLTNLWVEKFFWVQMLKFMGRELVYKCDLSEGFIFRNHLSNLADNMLSFMNIYKH